MPWILAGPPAKEVPKEDVGGFGRVLGAECALDPKPMIVVKIMLLRVR